MKKLFIIFLVHLSLFANAQSNDNSKTLNEDFSKEKVLSEIAEAGCKCIDSISTKNKNAKETSAEVKRCIYNQVIGYQSILKLQEAMASKNKKKVNVSINANADSEEYKQYYYEIENQLMENCTAIKEVVGMNNKESEKSISKNPKAIKEYNKGNDYFRKDDYSNAVTYFEKAVSLDPEFAFAWDNIGVCYRRLGNYDASLNAYQMSLKQVPNNVTALQNIALAYIGKKEYQKAIESYENLAKLDTENPEVYYGIGVVYFENIKDYEKSLDNICKAYSLYIRQNSPYRSDAEKVIQMLYNNFKSKGEEKKFIKILKSNNINIE